MSETTGLGNAVPQTQQPSKSEAELQAKIDEVIQILRKGEMFRGLCKLAWEHGLTPDEFGAMLKKTKLSRSRRSEILTVIESLSVWKGFLFDGKTWHETLELALNEKLGELERLASKLERLLDKHLPSLADGQQVGAWTFTHTHAGLQWKRNGALLEMLTIGTELI